MIPEPQIDDGAGSNEGPKEAFCPLLFEAGQGAVMVVTDDDGTYLGQQYVRGLCTKALDCDRCEYMQFEVSQHPTDEVTWVCPTCMDAIYVRVKKHNIQINVPGFYSEGLCQYPWCSRPDGDPINQPARYSRFRQIVFGRIRT